MSIPPPVSVTLILSRGPLRPSRHAAFTVTDPSAVNFTALLSRFSITWRSRATSPVTRSGNLSGTWMRIFNPLAAAWMAISPVVSSTSRRIENGRLSRLTWPASNLEKSSTSLMIASSASLASEMRLA